nr:hypothetical protein [Tanacetum cinerariifolium]
MSTIKFAKTHNLVALLEKYDESEGFEQIVDFLNVNPIKYALTIRALVDGKKLIINEASIRRDLKLEDAEGTAYLPNDTIFEELARMGRSKNQGGNKGRKLRFLTLSHKVLDLEKPKTAQAKEIDDLKKRVKKLERKKKSRTSSLKILWKERMIDNIDQDVKITLVDETQGRINEEEMFGVDDLKGDDDELTLDQILIEIKAAKPKARGVIVQELELKRYLEIVLEDDDDVTIEATPLSSKSSTIVDYKIYKEGRKSYFKIIIADGNSHNYLSFGKMFKNFNREDLEVLWSIVKERFKKTKPADDMDNLLFQTLKTMFEHQVEDNIWKYQQRTVKVLYWKLFDSHGELGKQDLGKLEVGKPGVDKQEREENQEVEFDLTSSEDDSCKNEHHHKLHNFPRLLSREQEIDFDFSCQEVMLSPYP